MNKDEYFEEVCWSCGHIKMVHNDYMLKLDDPAFICKGCEVKRDSFMNKAFVSLFSKGIET